MVSMKIAEKAVKSLWKDSMTVYGKKKVLKDNGATGFTDGIILENEPCRLSYKSVVEVAQGNVGAVSQTIKLFCDKSLEIEPGSVIEVQHEGKALKFKHSGEAAVYSVHQEIILMLYEEYA